ncbi:ATP-dependent nuclease [Alteribacillus iranensis]|uniref:Putative ATP-dependent endonuclease of the OLD family n=1 Tax=Alteribacillus iranensis TaxID=930128 RepID=A0A1I2DJA0_9BACI|nr:AAA family ATPase [Alteribacillus iranensis]SFE80695.1 putative ATP-dependent endonuclease of the OLD family [Alteribacillus iranensis]
MKFEKLHIKNFRNFKDVTVDLSNKNVVFGMNDVGKTNFLYAIRFLFDKQMRKNGFTDTDFYQNDTSNQIQITVKLDLSDYEESTDTKKLVAKAKDARTSEQLNSFYIRINSEYLESEGYGEPLLYWGSDLDNLQEIPSRGISFTLDSLFKVVYVTPLIELNSIFNKNKKALFDESRENDSDKQIMDDIKGLTTDLNNKIGAMSVIQGFQTDITEEYKTFKNEKINVEVKSEMAIRGFYSDLIPYIKRDGDENYYPTSGDGRKKILSYSILNYITKKEHEDKIVIYLIEEPENSLHRSMQIALSKQLFKKDNYKYFFMSTHSPELLYEMEDNRLIRIHSKDKIVCDSYLYNIEDLYRNVKRKLNKDMASAVFSNKVLLVEGPSERVLFEKILDEIYPEYELDGGFILEVGGIYFSKYVETLSALGITVLVKTDNDLKKKKGSENEYELLGINRCLKLMGEKELNNITVEVSSDMSKKEKERILTTRKKELFTQNQEIVQSLIDNKIYLSEVDLENDLSIIIGSDFDYDIVKYLQESKLFNMAEFINSLDEELCRSVFDSAEFRCLRDMVSDE